MYLIYDKDTNDYEYFFTKNHISKSLYALKNTKKDTKIKTIINNNNYQTELLKIYSNNSREQMNQELKNFKECSYITLKKLTRIKGLNQTFFLNYDFTLHTKTKNDNLKYGIERQNFIFDLINSNNIFGIKLFNAKYNFSEFDFYSNNFFIYEVKSLKYSYNKYPTAVMNTSKLIYPNFIFIFEYCEQNDIGIKKELYFYKYDPNRDYNKRYITPENRLYNSEIIDIPINELIKFYDGSKVLEFDNPFVEIKNQKQK